jgi:hypothetical protein
MNKNQVREIAKSCLTIEEFKKTEAWSWCVLNNCSAEIVKECFSTKRRKMPKDFSLEDALNIARKYQFRGEFNDKEQYVLNWIVRNGYKAELASVYGRYKQEKYSEEMVLALAKKYLDEGKTYKEFRSENPGMINWICRKNFLPEVFKILPKASLPITMEEAVEEAKKYKSKCDFLRGNSKAALMMRSQNKILYDALFERKSMTIQEAWDIAEKYQKRSQCKAEASYAYSILRKHGLLDQIFPKKKSA